MMNDKPDCSRHKKDVAGITDMKLLAEMIGDLHYETLYIFLERLSEKFNSDSFNDYKGGRVELSDTLQVAQRKIHEASWMIRKAWRISKPFMNKNDKS